MTRSGLLFLVAALIGGVALGYVAGTSATAPVSPGEELPDSPKKPEATTEWREREAAGGSGESGSLADVLRGIPDGDHDGAGDGVVTGVVKTADGPPLGDVFLRAVAMKDRGSGAKDTSGGAPEDKDLAEKVRDLVQDHRRDRELRREARTDAEGRYEIVGLGDGDYWIQAYKKGWRIAGSRGRSAYKIKAGSTVDFTAKPLIGVPVEVFLPDGTEPEAAWIEAKQGNRKRNHGWSPKHPTLHLPPGDYELSAIAGDDKEMKSEPASVMLTFGQAAEPMTFKLVLRPGIKGRVVFPEGAAQQYVQVHAMPVPDGKEPDPKRLMNASKQSWAYAGRPEFTLTDLEPGTWLVGILENYQRVLVHETVEVGVGFADLELEIPTPKPEDTVLVRVEGPDGKLLSDVRISVGLMTRHGPQSFGMGRGAVKQADGSWRVAHATLPPGWGGEGETDKGYVQSDSGKYGSKRVEYTKGTDTSVTIRYDEPASLVVTLSGYRGSSYEGATRLGLQPVSPGMRGGMSYGGRSQQGLDKDGVQEFKPLSPGDYQLDIYLQTEGYSQRLVHRETVTVKTGENRVTSSLPALHSLTILVPAAEEGTSPHYGLSSRDRNTPYSLPSGKKDDQNRVVFDMIPAGEYVFSIYDGRAGRKMYVTVPGPAVVRFAPLNFNAMEVSIDDATGNLAATGLKDGDLVIGVDNIEFENEIQMRARLMEARAKESAKLIVVRGRKRLVVAVDLTKTWGRNAGGRMTPAVR